ncbi:unnamed protein product [Bursaphelenchus xylophilus]|uniref:(pine wood nematode) hypothetical protein n=1 Tax=Bursaphelenchus xylophilus TaxID=6326 RepID=A0A811LHP4_BURXY|nr:unnamed protein product [Bursaphelenchus xylophilus]CAG9116082.1 unnamed protein product [Bursaphelenchus xylophilus]
MTLRPTTSNGCRFLNAASAEWTMLTLQFPCKGILLPASASAFKAVQISNFEIPPMTQFPRSPLLPRFTRAGYPLFFPVNLKPESEATECASGCRSITFRMSDIGRKATTAAAMGLIVIGIGLSIGAILTPSWQVVNLREYNSVHEHGLWLDCTRHTRDGSPLLRRYATINEPLHCVYKFDYDKYSGTFDLEDDNSPVGEVNRHKFYGWHTSTLILLALALLTAFLSLGLASCGCCYPSLSLLFVGATLVTTFLSSIAVGLFFFFSHRADNRFIKGIVGTYEQRVGLAFFLQMAATFAHFISFIIAMFNTYLSFSGKGGALERYSAPRSSHTNMTNIGRSMDFEQPVFHTGSQQFQNKNIKPIFYKSSTEEMGDSMPDLPVHRSYPDALNASRIRRKSETCV